jgi:demethoxyubiquinone hydroxylase (CLK1/Coq7/Cat5 family)
MNHTIENETARIIRDLHARVSLRLTFYRFIQTNQRIEALRTLKSHHQSFLRALLRKRELRPAWYAILFYYSGYLIGWFARKLPEPWYEKIERALEYWLLIRYEKYLKKLSLYSNLRSMIEAIQAHRLNHQEPGNDIITALQEFIKHQEQLLRQE